MELEFVDREKALAEAARAVGERMRDDDGRVAPFRERVREANRLRRTCDTCGRGGLEPVVVKRSSSDITFPVSCADVPLGMDDFGDAFYSDCPGHGHTVAQIAAALGVGKSAAGSYLSDLTGEKASARRGACYPCVECGHGMSHRPGSKRNPYWHCFFCREGRPSPTRAANSPTGFRVFEPRTECRCCGGPKAPGHHVCAETVERLAPIRVELAREAKRNRNPGLIPFGPGEYDDEPLLGAA